MPDRKPTVAVLTPPGRAAVATIVVYGPGAEQLVAHYFQPLSGTTLPLDRVRFGRWQHNQGEEVIVCRRRHRVEIQCHGGMVASAAIVDDLVRAGAVRGGWQEWLEQAGTSALRTEAHLALVAASTERVARCLLDQYRGALAAAVKQVAESLACGQPTAAMRDLQALRQSAELGLHLTTPWRVVISGPPNVGKSSLINALVGYQRAIVHVQAGTTRDLLTATTAIDGWPIELTDTAGIHDAGDSIEREGMRRARAASQIADLIIVVRDVSDPRTAAWQPPCLGQSSIIVGNKCDLLEQGSDATKPGAWPGHGNPDLLVSAKTGAAVDQLMQLLGTRLVPEPPRPGQAIIFTRRQLRIIDESIQAIDAASVEGAFAALRRIDWMDDLRAPANA